MSDFILTADNYYSEEANKRYMSVSGYKAFAGTLGKEGCEYEAFMDLQGNALKEKSDALILGSYVDAAFEGTLDKFKKENADLLFKKTTKKGATPEMFKEFIEADDAIRRAQKDPYFMKYMSGDKQTIMEGNLFGADWKIKTDSYLKNKAIVDLKYMRSYRELLWSSILHKKLDFIRFYGYDIQGAVYQEIVFQNTGKRLPFYIAAITKEKPCDIAIIQITQDYLDEALKLVEQNMGRVLAVKNGLATPVRCGNCPTCRRDKVLSAPIGIDDIMNQGEVF